MAITLTPEVLQAAYDFLRTTLPFSKWNLPDGEDVTFRVGRTKAFYGWCTKTKKGRHAIVISSGSITYTPRLFEVMAHEMVHLHEYKVRLGRHDVAHGVAFRKLAAQVCKMHGFDLKAFY